MKELEALSNLITLLKLYIMLHITYCKDEVKFKNYHYKKQIFINYITG